MSRASESLYWKLRKPASNLRYRLLRLTPAAVLYWFVVEAAVRTEPNLNPAEVTAGEMLKRLEK